MISILPLPSAARQQGHRAKAGSQPVDGDSRMGLFVGVDADDDLGGIGVMQSWSSAAEALAGSCGRTGL
ncbi:hypothetical protein DC522_33565 [Microvirga sp. KLBC 81]|uniref:hypothetical protein n=1 Tax=Microvirga sp. KLBC 81 TaxID=1862707 RepID=UPI000D510198|nr:hypothetical protein [Microvirga sp. KLBC 81]PVE20229.1 hypothetical protein DC522_33565 [Microvirga sp. KLBC 81]